MALATRCNRTTYRLSARRAPPRRASSARPWPFIPIPPPALAEVAILKGFPRWVLALLAAQTEERRLPREALVVKQHAPADTVWVLLEGSVEILSGALALGLHPQRCGTAGDKRIARRGV